MTAPLTAVPLTAVPITNAPIVTRQFYVPDIGEEIVLAEDWTFPLYREWRNKPLYEALGLTTLQNYAWWDASKAETVTLPMGTPLVVDRIYVRKGASDFSSLTFRVGKSAGDKRLRGKRFWAKLADVNRILFERPDPGTSDAEVKAAKVVADAVPYRVEVLPYIRDYAAEEDAIRRDIDKQMREAAERLTKTTPTETPEMAEQVTAGKQPGQIWLTVQAVNGAAARKTGEAVLTRLRLFGFRVGTVRKAALWKLPKEDVADRLLAETAKYRADSRAAKAQYEAQMAGDGGYGRAALARAVADWVGRDGPPRGMTPAPPGGAGSVAVNVDDVDDVEW